MTFTGSSWGQWDLQVQTVLDDDYKSLETYYMKIKNDMPEKWNQFVLKVGTEEDVLLFDSRAYFFQGDGSPVIRTKNYAKCLFSFLDVFQPDLRCIAITDHNHIHDALMNSLVKESAKHRCKVIPGVEINVDGVHLLALFSQPPCEQGDFSSGIKLFLSQLGVTNIKTNDAYTVVNNFSIIKVLDKIEDEGGITIFAHCNSSNGLLQEKSGKDRTVLAATFNHKSPVLLQSRTLETMEKTSDFIKTLDYLTSPFVKTIASDSKSLLEIGSPDKEGNRLFVKGLPCYEGLRQAIFEPASRIVIGQEIPATPVHRIDLVEFNFPDNTKLGNERFCLSGNYSIPLSPNYTCFIGGRGAGKSTILNAIHEKLNPGQNTFFQKKLVKIENKKADFNKYVNLDNGSEGQQVDFLSQNEIEKFATESDALTKVLYHRLEKGTGNELSISHSKLEVGLDLLDKHISTISDDNDCLFDIEKLKEKRQALEKVIKSFKSDEYNSLSSEISATSQLLSAFNNANSRFKEFKNKLLTLQNEYLLNEKTENKYELKIQSAVEKVREAIDILSTADENSLRKEREQLETRLADSRNALELYLQKRGLTDDNQSDVSNATSEIAEIDEEISALEKKHLKYETVIADFDIGKIEELKKEYEKELRLKIKTTNAGLTDLSKEVKAIKMSYHFDEQSCLESVYSEFKELFQINPARDGTKDNHLFEALVKGKPFELDGKDAFIDRVYKTDKKRELSTAENLLITTLEDDRMFRLFELIVFRKLYDPISFKQIDVFYDGKILADTSFGQRCTAALVLLVLLGNNPIIIDEPEGHLDSLLIANYLVGLIKQEKANRQIVFATHNANLVVNGDADLIYHLEINDQGTTVATPTVLEDLENRHRVISLEGGEDAFKRRETKYSV